MRPPRLIGRLLQDLSQARSRHALRHRPTGFGMALADRIDYLDGARWDELVRGHSFLLSRDYLRVLEQHGPPNLSLRYALAFRGPQPVAAIVVQVVDLHGARMVGGAGGKRTAPATAEPPPPMARLRRALGATARRVGRGAARRLRLRAFVCGNLLSWGPHGVAFAAGEDPAALWPAVAEALYRIRRADRLAGKGDLVLVKDLPPALTSGARALEPFGYRTLETEPDMVLAIPPTWRTFADYAQGLAAKYRKSVRQVEADVAAAGLKLERLGDLPDHAGRLHSLYLQVHERAAVRPVTLPPGFLPALAAVAGDRFRCTVVRRETQIVGFVTSLRDGDTCIGYHVGFDSAANEQAPIYFQLLQATIADAIDWSCRRLSLGRTALDPKARLGGKPQPLHVWLRHRSPALNLVLRPLLPRVPHAQAPERNPFKA